MTFFSLVGTGPADGPWIPCSFLPEEFVRCNDPILASPNQNGTKV